MRYSSGCEEQLELRRYTTIVISAMRSSNRRLALFCTILYLGIASAQARLNHTFPTVTSSDQRGNATVGGNGTTIEERCMGILEPVAECGRVVVTILLVIIVFVTIFGNILVIAAVLTFHELQTITNMFVGSLACADLIMGAVVLPLGIPYVLTGHWALGKVPCDIWISIDVLTVTASIETLCAIAIDRYFAITKPFTYTTNVTRTRARCYIALIWITSASIAFIPIQLGWWKDEDECAQWCYAFDECCEFMTNQTYAVVSSCISFYVPLTIMIFSYAIVFKEAIRHASQIDDQNGMFRRYSMPGTNRPLWNRQQRRTLFTMGYIMGIFAICWLPFFIVNLVQVFCHGCVNSSLFKTLNWIGYANSFFNPFIYSHNVQFRRAFTRLLTCLPCSEGFERTKRASLSTSFPRYRESQRDSTLYMLTQFFLSGGSSRKKSRKSTSSSGMYKRDSRLSPSRSPNRHPRFRRDSEDLEVHGRNRPLNNNDMLTTNGYTISGQNCYPSCAVRFSSDNRSDTSYESAPSPTDSSLNNTSFTNVKSSEQSELEIVPSYTYERKAREADTVEAVDVGSFYPSRRYSDFGNSLHGLKTAVSLKDVLKHTNSKANYVAVPTIDVTILTSPERKRKRSKSLFPQVSTELLEETEDRVEEPEERENGVIETGASR